MTVPVTTPSYSPPEPFVGNQQYYAQYFTEIMSAINTEEDALSITKTMWYRYLAVDSREEIGYNPTETALIDYALNYKDYVLDIRNAYEKAGGLFETWKIELKDWLGSRGKDFDYETWLHAEATLGELNNLFDRDIEELRFVDVVALDYFYVSIAPGYVEKDGANPSMTDEFTITVEAWVFGTGGTVPEGGFNKLEGTQSYKVVDSEPEQEDCYTDQIVVAVKDTAFNGIIDITTLLNDIEGISLYKVGGWDKKITLASGVGSVEGVRYKTDDNSDLDSGGVILVQGGYTE